LGALAVVPLHAQLTRGTILGTIQDPSGSVVPNATVKVVNKSTGVERSTTSNEAGVYRFPGIDPGTYDVSFTAPAFAVNKVDGVLVTTSQEVTLNQSLKLGQTSEIVEVAEAPPGVELAKTSATIERTFPNIFLANVSSTSGTRDINTLALLAPTAV